MHSQSCLTLCDPTDCSPPGSLSMEFFRQEYWSGWPFPSTGDLPNRGIEPAGVQRQAVLYHWATWETNQVSIARRKGKATSYIHASQRPEQICIYSLIAGKSQERVSSWDANLMSREHSKGSGLGAVTGPPGKQWSSHTGGSSWPRGWTRISYTGRRIYLLLKTIQWKSIKFLNRGRKDNWYTRISFITTPKVLSTSKTNHWLE